MMEDIITALATAWGEGGIAVVRLSGEGSVELADRLYRGNKKLANMPPRYLALGHIISADGRTFDEVLAVRYERGSSYTAEESVEIHCHGGALPAQKCIEELCALGARVAHPGEFTRRAFVNGRIDLSQAEAVIGVIRSESDEALYASSRTMQGEFAGRLKEFLSEMTLLAAHLEADLDFPDEGEGFLPEDEIKKRMETLIASGEKLADECRSGLILREGVRAAIIGRPNVGKSSLLNALLEEERAIVTSVPGTTRDSVEETFVHKGVPIRIADTAGIRETKDEVERIGIDRSIRIMEAADICLWVIDSGEVLSPEDLDLGRRAAAMKHIIVLNKSDGTQRTSLTELAALFPSSRILPISALRLEGIEELKDLLIEEITSGKNVSGGYSVTSRQIGSLYSAIASLKEAEGIISSNLGRDLAISCIFEARGQISGLLGVDVTEDLLDTLFSQFCVGK